MKIQKMVFRPQYLSAQEILTTADQALGTETELFTQWPAVNPVFTCEKAPNRDAAGGYAYRLEAAIPAETFNTLLPGFLSADARVIFIGSALETGWDVVPEEDEVAYLYAKFQNGELKSVCKFWGEVRHYETRGQLLPNLVRFKRIVVLTPDILPFMEEAFSVFSQRCYVIGDVARRVAGKFDDLNELARLNGVTLSGMAAHITLMEKLTAEEAVLRAGRFRLDPVFWPIFTSQ